MNLLKKISLSCLFILSCKPFNKQEFKLISQYPSFMEFLYNEKFGSSSRMHSLTLEFIKEKKFEIQYGSEGWYWNVEGEFDISGEEVHLIAKKCEGWENLEGGTSCEKFFQKAKCNLAETKGESIFQYVLLCNFDKKFHAYTSFTEENQMDFFLKNHLVESGKKLTLSGVEFLMIDKKSGVTTDSVVLREGPGLEFDKIEVLPAGQTVTVFGRTVSKYKVEKWENHWLLVQKQKESGFYFLFGEFVKY